MMETRKLAKLSVLVLALVMGAISSYVNVSTADADTRCPTDNPFGGPDIELCPHLHPPEDSESCISSFTDEDYEFRISNNTGYPVHYSVNGESYTLSNDRFREHEEQKAYGTSNCNIREYPAPRIRFDYSYADGFQAQEYTLSQAASGWAHYSFDRVGNGLNLHFVSANQQSGSGTDSETSTISLRAPFRPDPHRVTVTAEGTQRASTVRSGCAGYVGTQPTLRLNWSGSANKLQFFVTSSADTILLIRNPSGSYSCNDDWTGGDTNPMLSWTDPRSGLYTVWVGTYSGGSSTATLHITANPSLNPRNPR